MDAVTSEAMPEASRSSTDEVLSILPGFVPELPIYRVVGLTAFRHDDHRRWHEVIESAEFSRRITEDTEYGHPSRSSVKITTLRDLLSFLARSSPTVDAREIRVEGFSLPFPLQEVAERIEHSHAMVELEDNWDGEGSPRYDEATWRRAVQLVVGSTTRFWDSKRQIGPLPVISTGPDGSVDVLWRTPRRKILINVPADQNELATFYGNDRIGERREIEGSLDPLDSNEWILVWMTE